MTSESAPPVTMTHEAIDDALLAALRRGQRLPDLVAGLSEATDLDARIEDDELLRETLARWWRERPGGDERPPDAPATPAWIDALRLRVEALEAHSRRPPRWLRGVADAVIAGDEETLPERHVAAWRAWQRDVGMLASIERLEGRARAATERIVAHACQLAERDEVAHTAGVGSPSVRWVAVRQGVDELLELAREHDAALVRELDELVAIASSLERPGPPGGGDDGRARIFDEPLLDWIAEQRAASEAALDELERPPGADRAARLVALAEALRPTLPAHDADVCREEAAALQDALDGGGAPDPKALAPVLDALGRVLLDEARPDDEQMLLLEMRLLGWTCRQLREGALRVALDHDGDETSSKRKEEHLDSDGSASAPEDHGDEARERQPGAERAAHDETEIPAEPGGSSSGDVEANVPLDDDAAAPSVGDAARPDQPLGAQEDVEEAAPAGDVEAGDDAPELPPTGEEVVSAPEGETEPPSTEAAHEARRQRTHTKPLPAHLVSARAFKEVRWISPITDIPEPAPWADRVAFDNVLRTAATTALRDERLSHLWIFSRALELREGTPALPTEDIEALAALAGSPGSASAGRARGRTKQLRAAVELDSLDEPLWRVRLFLAAVRPGMEERLTIEEADYLVERAGFEDGRLAGAVLGLLRLGALGFSPVATLAEEVRPPSGAPASRAELEESLDAKREDYQRLVRQNWSAAGGRIQRTHCREAWARFMTAASSTLRRFYPVEHGGDAQWNTGDASRSIDEMVEQHHRIADEVGARFQDRAAMNRVVQSIADLACEINELRGRIDELDRPRHRSAAPVDVPSPQLEMLRDGGQCDALEEELCRQILLRLVRAATGEADLGSRDLLALRGRDLLAHPDLVAVMPDLAPDDLRRPADEDVVLCSVHDVAEPLHAAAILMTTPSSSAGEASEPLVAALREHFRTRGRVDLLARVAAALTKTERRELQFERDEAIESLFRSIRELRSIWRDLDALARPVAPSLPSICEAAEESVAGDTDRDVSIALIKAWVEEVAQTVSRLRDEAIEALRADPRANSRPEVARALDAGRYADALRVLGEPVDDARDHVRTRETPFREDASSLYTDVVETLWKMTTARGEQLFPAWSRGIRDRQILPTAQKVLTEFTNFVIPTEVPRERGQKHRVSIDCRDIRRHLSGQNPTFLPQLANFRQLDLVAPKADPRTRRFLTEAQKEVLSSGDEDLCVLLAPGLVAARREELLRELRKQRTIAAVIDDLDICRLYNPEGHTPNALIGLFEIAFEQASWERLSPFQSGDGQHVKMEMFVGRQTEGERVALRADYSRLFSGRKLGKSALLKYVQARYDGAELPAGLTLRVVYAPIVGAANEADVVERIRAAMREQLDVATAQDAGGAEPARALADTLDRYLEDRPGESLLIVLDEADRFVESQLEAYEERREACLSFLMRTQMTAKTDETGLPRVRFVFTGYRTTSTRGGAWANWGQVLRLEPLEPAEAALLIEGPLARLGVDASGHSNAIAFRCGYQPAVILSFGRRLLARIERRRAFDDSTVRVTAADVTETFNDPEVRADIRTIVVNNFHGNRAGLVLFRAVVLEFSAEAPGRGIEDLPRRILERLGEMEAGTKWFCDDTTSAHDEVIRYLDDFVARHLLVSESSKGATVYSLRFPHHLTVLTQHDQAADLRADLKALEDNRHPHTDPEAYGLLSKATQDQLTSVVVDPPDPDLPVAAAIIGSHWPEAVGHQSGGVPDRLGIEPRRVYRVGDDVPPYEPQGKPWAVDGVTPADIAKITSTPRDGGPPPLLLGGADLLRWAASQGGVLGNDELIEMRGLGRLSRRMVKWWFHRIRGLEFDTEDALTRIMAVTSGIPLLLRRVDALLCPENHPGGIDISAARLAGVLEAVQSEPEADAKLLVEGEPWCRLEARELDVLRMVATASRHGAADGAALDRDLTEDWELYAEHCDAEALDPDDAVAVTVVLGLGLVPANPAAPALEGLRCLVAAAPNDALHRLVAALDGVR